MEVVTIGVSFALLLGIVGSAQASFEMVEGVNSVTGSKADSTASAGGPYYLLNPDDYAGIMGGEATLPRHPHTKFTPVRGGGAA